MVDERYARLAEIDWWEVDRLRKARAIVAGVGALGNEVVKNLLLMGWGSVVVVDLDRVEMTNLSRSPLFRPDDVGRPKAEVIAERARAWNADTAVTGLVGDLRLRLTAGTAQRADVIFGCLDNVAARVALSQLAGQSGTLLVDGGLATWEGTVQTFAPALDTACYSCTLTTEDIRELTLRHSCLAYLEQARAEGRAATTPIVSSVTAALMVQQGLKWLHRGRHDLPLRVGEEIRVDVAYSRCWTTALPMNEDCPVHWQPVVPVRSELISADMPWTQIVQGCREVLATEDVSVHLPVRVLTGWECLSCGATERVAQAHAGDGRLACASCGEDAVPQFVVELDGSEPWCARSPREMGFGPWTWITALVREETVTIEIQDPETPPTREEGDQHGDEAPGTQTGQ